ASAPERSAQSAMSPAPTSTASLDPLAARTGHIQDRCPPPVATKLIASINAPVPIVLRILHLAKKREENRNSLPALFTLAFLSLFERRIPADSNRVRRFVVLSLNHEL